MTTRPPNTLGQGRAAKRAVSDDFGCEFFQLSRALRPNIVRGGTPRKRVARSARRSWIREAGVQAPVLKLNGLERSA